MINACLIAAEFHKNVMIDDFCFYAFPIQKCFLVYVEV